MPDITSSEITTEQLYLNRREFIARTALAAASTVVATNALATAKLLPAMAYKPVDTALKNGFYTDEDLVPYEHVAGYNNFYEFGTDKTDPARYAESLQVDPWSISIEGEVAKPGVYALEDVLRWVDIEERVYRLRCVEAWSMVVPWLGFSLLELLKKVEPTSKAKYVAFETVYRPAEMPGQRSRTSIIDWPYVEALRMDEAVHPLTMLAVGLYGREMPKQNGAPIRLVVPWKYGFKSIKSIVRIRLVEKQPPTTWQSLAPHEYGFYANVNPEVDHPRWSQRVERRLPSTLFNPNRMPTQMFNGYGEQVAHLYKGMNLRTFY